MVPVSLCTINTVNAASIALKWSRATGLRFGGGLGPLVVDVNNDGYPEVIASGDNSPNPDKMYCLNGRTGAVIWQITLPYSIAPHSLMEIYDLNKDGRPEIVQAGPNGMMVFRGDTGALLWKNSEIKGGEEHQLVLDTDHTGYPYIYTVNGATDGSARLRKINGSTGHILISKNYWYACHGGLSAGDIDGHGTLRLYSTDRNSGNGKGVQCYDPKTLTLLWSRPDIGCSSHLAVLTDVNKDGVLDVVISQQRDDGAGIYCLNARTGANIPGKCQDSIPGLGVHEAFPVYDIDNDGHLELATCSASAVKVFDLTTWTVKATLAVAGKSPYYANVLGDSNLEIILSDQTTDIKIYNNAYQLAATLSIQSYGSTVADIDNDGLNELIDYGADGTIRAYDTPAATLNPTPRTNTEHFSELRTRTEVYIPPPTVIINHPPATPTALFPENESSNISVNPQLQWSCNDPDNDTLTYTLYVGTSSPPPLQTTGLSQTSYNPGTLNQGQWYYWRVNATDSKGAFTLGPIWNFQTVVPPQTLTKKWDHLINAKFTGCVSPVIGDVDNDGSQEILLTGDFTPSADKVLCFNGTTGALKWCTTVDYPVVAHNPLSLYDLNHDSKLEVIVPSPKGLLVLNGNDGSLYWRNATIKCGENYPLVLDTDHTGYPYIYTCYGSTSGGLLKKIDGRTGRTLLSKPIGYPARGGFSAADVDNDGHIELYLTDTVAANGGKGIQCYDAGTLTLKWCRDTIECSSHLPVLVDVNNDGVLDVVVSQQRNSNAGIYCLDGRTGINITGKCQDSIPGLASRENFPVADIDGDGNLELATTIGGVVKLFDLGKWKIDGNLSSAGKPPYFANVLGNTNLDIVESDQTHDLKIYSGTAQLLYTLSNINSTSSIVQDVDGDGLNELVVLTNSGHIIVYDTPAASLSPLPRTVVNNYSEHNTRAAIYTSAP